MDKREKVLKGLKCCNSLTTMCGECPYYDRCSFLKKDALEVLEEIEAEPEIEGGGSTWFYVCSECRGAIDGHDRFCKHCGARMKRAVKLA